MVRAFAGDRILALLALTIGNSDEAILHFEEALSFCRKAGYRPELAWVCFDYGNALLRCNTADDAEKSKALLEEALSISVELGMRPLKEKLESL